MTIGYNRREARWQHLAALLCASAAVGLWIIAPNLFSIMFAMFAVVLFRDGWRQAHTPDDPPWVEPVEANAEQGESSRELGERIIDVLGPEASRDLLDALTRPEDDRAALMGRLYQRADGGWLAELLVEIESDPDDLVRLRLADALRSVLD